jgi:hypothetical protein
MKESGSRQIHEVKGKSVAGLTSGIKCVTVAIYEISKKTVLQPLVTEQEAKMLPKLFENKTLELWLSNGKSDASLFDVAILKYGQMPQPPAKCSKIPNQVRLKNLIESISCRDQCSFSGEWGDL